MTYNRIALISDLHLDFWEHHYRQKNPRPTINDLYTELLMKCAATNPDLIVVAGDVTNGYMEKPFLINIKLGSTSFPIMYVPGNHDFYGLPFPETLEWKHTDQIVGTTLWTTFDGAVGLESMIYDRIADSAHIRNTSAMKVQQMAHQSWDLLKMMNKEIIVTHFPPSPLSIAEKFKGDMTNAYFVNNFDNQIAYGALPETKLWMFGHVHHKHSYMMGDILCVCNPLGYPGEMRKSISDYQPQIIIKVDGQWQVSEN